MSSNVMENFRILGSYCNSPTEEIDTAETKDEADYLKNEYMVAFGFGWSIWVEDTRYPGCELVDSYE